MNQVEVRLVGGSYQIQIAAGLFARLGELVRSVAAAPSAAVVSDANVAALYGQSAVESLRSAGYRAALLTFPAGEEQKTVVAAAGLWDRLAEAGLERSSPVVALGGGVTGDLAGFAAACYLRGLPVIQAPTTLLACVDSSVGGKTGVNHPTAGKNSIGAFHQPRAVAIDPLLLATLPAREWLCGLAETVKHAVIRDEQFFDWLEERAGDLADLAGNAAERVPEAVGELAELIERNCRIKAAVVMADERESNVRAILNFGHTAGHAIETLAGYGTIHHGEAVSMGMMVAARIAQGRSMVGPEWVRRLGGLLAKLHLPTAVPANISTGAILEMAGRDKKVRGGRVRFVLPAGSDGVEIIDDVSSGEFAAAVDASR